MSSSYSYSSSSYTTSSTSNGANGTQTTGSRSAHASSTDPSGNTTVQSASQNLGEPVVAESRQYDSQGRELIGEGSGSSAGRIAGSEGEGPRIEEVTDENEKKYLENMEDEYAKREGGA